MIYLNEERMKKENEKKNYPGRGGFIQQFIHSLVVFAWLVGEMSSYCDERRKKMTESMMGIVVEQFYKVKRNSSGHH